nr:MAG TPA: hypothetical protein [Caudoviricetes sp.]
MVEHRKSPFQVLHLKWACDTRVIHVVFKTSNPHQINLRCEAS